MIYIPTKYGFTVHSSQWFFFFTVKIKSARKSRFCPFWDFSRTGFFFLRTLFHEQLRFFTDTFRDFFSGIFFSRMQNWGFVSILPEKIRTFLHGHHFFLRCEFEEIFTETFCFSRALFNFFSRAIQISKGRRIFYFHGETRRYAARRNG